MKTLIGLIVVAAIVALALFLTGGIFVQRADEDAITINGRTIVDTEVCRYLTLEGIKTVPVGAKIGGVTLRMGEGCPFTYNEVLD